MLAVKGAKATTYSSFQIVKIILCQHLSVIWEARAAEWRDWERIRNPDIGVRLSSFQIAFISFDPRRSTGSSAGAAVMLATESTGNSPWLAQSLAAANGGKGTVTRPPHHQDTALLSLHPVYMLRNITRTSMREATFATPPLNPLFPLTPNFTRSCFIFQFPIRDSEFHVTISFSLFQSGNIGRQ